MTRLLFVYGTLRPGQPNPASDRLASGSRSLGRAHVRGGLTQVHGFPALLPKGTQRIDGELLLVEEEALWEVLDRHEGVGEAGWYRRTLVVAIDDKGQARSAWTYMAAP